MKNYLVLFFAIFCLNYANAKNNKVDSIKLIQQKNIESTNELLKLRSEVEYTKSLVQVGNGTISNQLSSSQHNLNSLSILFTFISIILIVVIPIVSWYITRLSNRVSNNLEQATTILRDINVVRQEVLVMQTDVNSIQETIKNNLSALYQSLKDEEIKAIFRRLEAEPLDIKHFFPTLATVKLSQERFKDFINIFNAVKDIDDTKDTATCVLILLCSHFPNESFNNPTVVEALKAISVTQGFYIKEIAPFLNELLAYINQNNFDNCLSLCVLTILGAVRSHTGIQTATLILDTFNKSLLSDQKAKIIAALKVNPHTPMLINIVNWEDILKIN